MPGLVAAQGLQFSPVNSSNKEILCTCAFMLSDVAKAKADNTSKGFFIFIYFKLSVKSIVANYKINFNALVSRCGKSREKMTQNAGNQIYYLVSDKVCPGTL